jgi:oxygen-independent coproporphyrinogen-3 oxidase
MADLTKLLSARVPRYTSYPTAVQFHAGVTGDTHRNWISSLPAGAPLSLYFHVPFCKQLCWFCGCHTHVANTYRPVKAYLELIRAEMELAARALLPGHKVQHIHWGGGSPTILQPADIETFTATIRSLFDVAPDAEFAVEVDPRTITQAMADAFGRAGVNRASLGVQDCDTTVLAAVNRMQTIETTRDAVAMLRAAGVSRLNIDLMYGLPHQTVEGVCRTIDAVHEMRPDRLAVFGYAHLPSFKPQQALIDEAALPGPDERYAQYEAGRARLQAHGYEAIGLDHFAWPDDQIAAAHRARRLSRNFQGYTTDEAPVLIGFGSSAISAFPGGYTQNAVGMPEYRKAIMSGNFATSRGVELTADDRLRRDVISDLMCYGTCNLAQTAIRHGMGPGIFDDNFPAIDALAQDGLVERKGYRLRIPDGAHAGVRVVCAALDRYLSKAPTRHATAV